MSCNIIGASWEGVISDETDNPPPLLFSVKGTGGLSPLNKVFKNFPFPFL